MGDKSLQRAALTARLEYVQTLVDLIGNPSEGDGLAADRVDALCARIEGQLDIAERQELDLVRAAQEASE